MSPADAGMQQLRLDVLRCVLDPDLVTRCVAAARRFISQLISVARNTFVRLLLVKCHD